MWRFVLGVQFAHSSTSLRAEPRNRYLRILVPIIRDCALKTAIGRGLHVGGG
jgi:hypothetical protein